MADVNDAAAEGPAGAATTALVEEMVLNAAMAFAGHAVTAAQEAAEQAAQHAPPELRDTIVRQFWLETANLCLRRLGESYGGAARDAGPVSYADLLEDGSRQATEARAAVEALGDLGLDLLDRLMDGE